MAEPRRAVDSSRQPVASPTNGVGQLTTDIPLQMFAAYICAS
jgi:hypothetical protein